MTILDIIILIILAFGAIKGFKSGAITQTISLAGTILVVILSFLLKGPLTIFLCKIFPFFSFSGSLAGITVLNLLIYEVISFFILVFVLLILERFLLYISKILDKIINLTIILTLPNKLIGLILGTLENYIFVFIILYILALPVFDLKFINESKFNKKILESTPILNTYGDKTLSVANELVNLKDKYKETENKKKFNLEALDVLLKYDITKVESVDELVKIEKLKIDDIEKVLIKYREN